jgi:PAS domain S-box-containing protein
MNDSSPTDTYSFLADGGNMGVLIREKDWAATSLGAIEQWPQSLKTTLSTFLPSRFPVVLFWGPDLIQFYNNAAANNIQLGGRHPAVLGQRAEECWADLWPTVQPMIADALLGKTVGDDHRLIPVVRNGQQVDAYWAYSYSPVRNETGQVTGVLVAFTETTHTVTIVKRYQEQEEKLRFAINATELGTWSFDPITEVTDCNQRLRSWIGQPDDALLTRTLIRQSIVPDDRPLVSDAIAFALSPASGGQYDIIYRIINLITQEQRTVRARGQAHFRDTVAYRFSGTLQDITAEITAQQKLEKANEDLLDQIRRFAFVTDFMPQMVWSTLPDGRQDFFNQRWFDFTGLTHEGSVGRGWASVLHPDDYDKAIAAWFKSMETGAPYEVEYRMRRHDGQYRWLLGRALPLRDEISNKVVRWFGTCTDIHDQKTLSDTLEQQVEERTSALQLANLDLKRSNENLERFAYVASHDLQEPLRKIQSFGDILKSTYGDQLGDGLSYLERMQGAAGRMSVLIKDLLSFSRISTQRESFKPVPLQRVVQDVQSDLELIIQETGARLDVGPLPTVWGDEGQLDQLVMNLISNALKFHQANQSPHISIRSERIPATEIPTLLSPPRPARHYHRLTITDNGIGFDEKYADRIFQVFQRLHNRNQYSGTGIGLAIVQKVVENHGGLITVASQPGQGTTFTVYLPG